MAGMPKKLRRALVASTVIAIVMACFVASALGIGGVSAPSVPALQEPSQISGSVPAPQVQVPSVPSVTSAPSVPSSPSVQVPSVRLPSGTSGGTSRSTSGGGAAPSTSSGGGGGPGSSTSPGAGGDSGSASPGSVQGGPTAGSTTAANRHARA